MPHFDTTSTAVVAAIGGALLMAIIALLGGPLFSRWEHATVRVFGSWTQSHRWFSFWLFAFPTWVVIRAFVLHRFDWDTVTLTALWSWAPFAVENVLKVTQGKALDSQTKMLEAQERSIEVVTDLVIELRAELDRSSERDALSESRDHALLGICERIYAALDARANHGAQGRG